MIGAVVVLRDFYKPIGYVVQQSGCWEWTGAIKGNGYGSVHIGGKGFQAHRYVYELLRGQIPVGMTLDHLCRNRRCVRPDHLEPVTQKENGRRGIGPVGQNYRKTHCIHGHPFDERNTYWRSNGKRMCYACSYLNLRRHRGSTRFVKRKAK